MNADRLLAYYERIADAPDAIVRFRRFILDLAVRGKLVEQEPNDEPASELLKRIATKKARLVKTRKTKSRDVLNGVNSDEFPFGIPAAWCWVRFGNIADYSAGRTPSRNEPSFWNSGDRAWVSIADMKDGETLTSTKETVTKKAARQVFGAEPEQVGTIIMSFKLTIGKIARLGIPAYHNEAIISIRPYVSDLDSHLFKVLPIFARQGNTKGAIKGATLNRKSISNILIPLPPLAEQHRIVAKVDKLMALCDRLEVARAEREATRDRLATASFARLNVPDPDSTVFQGHAAFVLENLAPLTTRIDQIKALRQTILNLAVCGKLVEQDPKDEPTGEALERIRIEREGFVQRKIIRRERPLAKIGTDEPPFEIPLQWRWKRIGEVALFTQYGTSTKSIPSEQGVPVLTMGNIQDGVVVWGNEKKIPATSDEFPALFLKKFDLLYNRTNSAELVGKTGIYLGEDDCKTFASYLIRVQLSKTSSSPRYMNLVMNAPVFRETQIIPLIKKQTGQANVNGTALKNMLVPLPPLPEQHRIVAKVDELMALCDRLEINLGIADTGRQHLLESLLRDVLVPRNEPCKVRRQ